jgi:1-acyl-sn-glycerol-3-phosphate acyltransferase
LLLLFAICVPLHVATKLLFRTSGWPRRFLAASAWVCGARVRTDGSKVAPHTLLVCNHTSWLDILVLAGASGCAFVSKDSLGHSLVHWMADQNHTLYVRRDDRRGASAQAEAVRAKLHQTQPLAIFPEGTTGPGTHLLAFRAPLFEGVTPPPAEVMVRPVAIDYGPAAPEVGWYEESGKANVVRLLGRRGSLPVTVHLLDPLPPMDHRKALAEAARSAIEAALSSSRRDPRV